MEQFLQQLQTIPEVAELIRRVEDGGCPAAVTGLQPVQRAGVGAAVARAAGRPAVFVCGDDREARQLTTDLAALTGQTPVPSAPGTGSAAVLRRCTPWPRAMSPSPSPPPTP